MKAKKESFERIEGCKLSFIANILSGTTVYFHRKPSGHLSEWGKAFSKKSVRT